MSTVAEKLVTAEEFLRRPEPRDGSKQELVRGVIVSMSRPGFRHGKVANIIGHRLLAFLELNLIGTATQDTGVRTESNPDTIRGPDLIFWGADKIPITESPVGYPDVIPDLCVEVLSPSNTPRQIRDKLREYFFAGVRLVWVVDPELQCVTTYRQPDEGRLLHDNAVLNGEDVLTGFSCPVHKLFTL